MQSNIVNKQDREYLKIIGLEEENLSLENLRKAYKTKAIEYHPDKNGNEEKFKELSNAYSELLKKFDKDNIKEILEKEELDEFDVFLYEILEEIEEEFDEISKNLFENLKNSYSSLFDNFNVVANPDVSFVNFMNDVTEDKGELEIVKGGIVRNKIIDYENIEKMKKKQEKNKLIMQKNRERKNKNKPKVDYDSESGVSYGTEDFTTDEDISSPEIRPMSRLKASLKTKPMNRLKASLKAKPMSRLKASLKAKPKNIIPKSSKKQFMTTFQKKHKVKNHPHIYCKVPVSLEDLYFNKEKVVSIKSRRLKEYVINEYLISPAVRKRIWKNRGDLLKFGEEQGDLIIQTELEPTKNYYIQGDYDLVRIYKLSLYEYIFTEDIALNFFGEKIKINRKLDCETNSIITIGPPSNTFIYPNKGLIKNMETGERGNLIIKLSVIMRSDTCVEISNNIREFFPPLIRKSE